MTVQRIEWTCPDCGKRYAIPSHMPAPERCPACREKASAIAKAAAQAADEAAERAADEQEHSEPAEQPSALAEIAELDLSPAGPRAKHRSQRRRAASLFVGRGESEKRFPALRLIALVYRILAALAFVGAIVTLALTIAKVATTEASPERSVAILTGLAIFGGGIVTGVTLLAFAELIYVQLAIEENTRRANPPIPAAPDQEDAE